MTDKKLYVDEIKLCINSSTKEIGVIGSPSDSFEATIDILEISSKEKILGELVFFSTPEAEHEVISVGQITEVMTINKWHEEPSFKAVIKRHGELPHLSDKADNRIAKLNIQSSFHLNLKNQQVTSTNLTNSPSTGIKIKKMSDPMMESLVKPLSIYYRIEYLGYAYGTKVKIPFWFKHFGKTDINKNGANDAYHIGVFGKTGSGKTTTAAKMIAGYTNNADVMSFLIIDPQGQFYNDDKILPNASFKDLIEKNGIKSERYLPIEIPKHMCLPSDPGLFSELLLSSGFISDFFKITSEEKKPDAAGAIEEYLYGRHIGSPNFLSSVNSDDLLNSIAKAFLSEEPTSTANQSTDTSKKPSSSKKDRASPSKYMSRIYSHPSSIQRTEDHIKSYLANPDCRIKEKFSKILNLFKKTTGNSSGSLNDMIKNLLEHPGYVYILNLSTAASVKVGGDNFQAKLINVILTKIIEEAELLNAKGSKPNCLIVMDEAHRYINSRATNPRLKELNAKIVDSVRTVRKYGIGHMFITQTIESIDEEVTQQMRIFAFGYGLTMSHEFAKVKQLINDDNAAKFYKSFIDPSSNGKYPFMFHGPISPLSFTGSPLFLEMY